MTKTSVNIYLRKDGRYEGRYLKPDKNEIGEKTRYGYVYGATYEEAYAKLLRKKEAYERELSIHDNHFLTIKELMEAWLSSISGNVKPGTFSTYQNYVNKYLIPRIGSIYAAEFDKHAMEAVLNSFQKKNKDGRELAKNTIYLLEEIIRLIFKYGQEKNLIPSIEFSRVANRSQNKKEVLLLSEQERKRLVEIVHQKEIGVQVSILLPLYTGMSLSELCGLKWKDIDLEHGRIRIVRGVKRVQNHKEQGKTPTSLVEYDLKEEECREFSLPESMVELLERANSFTNMQIKTVEESFSKFQTDAVEEIMERYVAALDKRQPEGRTLQYRLDHIGYEAGIEKVNFRMLRDTFAIKCLQVGGDIYNLSYVLGIGISAACERYGDWIIRDDEILKRIG